MLTAFALLAAIGRRLVISAQRHKGCQIHRQRGKDDGYKVMARDLESLVMKVFNASNIIHTHLRKMKPNRRMAAELVAAAMRGRDAIFTIYPVVE